VPGDQLVERQREVGDRRVDDLADATGDIIVGKNLTAGQNEVSVDGSTLVSVLQLPTRCRLR